MGRAQTDEQMNVICNATDRQRNTVDSFNDAAEVSVQVGSPLRIDERQSVLRTEDKMIVKTKVSRRHEASPVRLRMLERADYSIVTPVQGLIIVIAMAHHVHDVKDHYRTPRLSPLQG